jgi:phage protein D
MTTELALASGIIYRAHPTIEIDGQRDERVQTLLLAMEMQEAEGGLSSLELRFRNTSTLEQQGVDFAFEYSEHDLLSLGKSIRILAGDESDPQEIFRGIISGLELVMEQKQEPELIVLAEDALQKARMARHTQLHTDTSLRSLVESVAADLGLRAAISGLSDNISPQMQLNETHLAFLRRLLQRYDADVQVVGEELQVSPRSDVRRNEINLEINSQLKNIRVLADLAHQVTEVTFSGWDFSQGRAISASSDGGADLGPGSGRTGTQILAEAFEERPEHISSTAAADEAEARALANARYSKCARQFVTVEGKAEGNPNLRVGSHVSLRGLGPRFENTYYVTRVCHRYDDRQGYKTEFEAQGSYFGG